MAGSSRDFPDPFEDDQEAIDMSDEELEALLLGSGSPAAEPESASVESLEAGARISGMVIDFRGGEILVEIDSKTHGVVDESEFEDEDLPAIGSTLQASFVRFDAARALAVLSVRGARKEIFWDELRPGLLVEGTVTEVNKGGLTLDIRGARAFLPISQIERERVEDPSAYVGARLRCEVTSFDRADQNLVVSRRAILEREAAELRGKALARLGEGEVLKGTVVRLIDAGAIVDLGGAEGLLHSSKIRERHQELGREKSLEVGQQIEVTIVRIDRERGRVSLDFHRLAGETWSRSVEGYSAGDEATGWITNVTPDGAAVSLEEGVEGWIPRRYLLDLTEPPRRGSLIRVTIASIDLDEHRIELRPQGAGEPEDDEPS
ncbi:MAG: 30S ribosomal protein S1 [Planctomycetes bacterium]|nr:30S ribosomal protein S1 [Planctomycetota bacterium]